MPPGFPQPPDTVTEAARVRRLGHRIIWDESRPFVPSRLEIYLVVIGVLLLLPGVGIMIGSDPWYEGSLLMFMAAGTVAVPVGMWLYHAVRPVEWCSVYDEGLVFQRSGTAPVVVTWPEIDEVRYRRQFLGILGSDHGPGLSSTGEIRLHDGRKIGLRRRFDDAQEIIEKVTAAVNLAAVRDHRRLDELAD